jgi:hypothetical protein
LFATSLDVKALADVLAWSKLQRQQYVKPLTHGRTAHIPQ